LEMTRHRLGFFGDLSPENGGRLITAQETGLDDLFDWEIFLQPPGHSRLHHLGPVTGGKNRA